MSQIFHGGVSKVEFVLSSEGFDGTDPVIIEIDDNDLIAEGMQVPEPEGLTQELASGQDGPTGEDVPWEVRAKKMDAADADTLRDAGYDNEPYDCKFTSADGVTEMVIKKQILQVMTHPIAERGAYGFVRIMGKGTSSGKAKPYEVTQTTP